jgi:16S rRNA processing protein RimM
MDIKSSFKIGYVLRPHGLKGEVTISVDPEAPENLHEIESCFLLKNDQLIPYFVESISIRGDKGYLKFEDVDSPEAAQAISKCALYLPKSERPKSLRGEFYDDEIIGFEVFEVEQGAIGKIVEVIMAGPNKLLSIDNAGKEVLIPVNGPFITDINKTKKKVTVELPEGFLDL